MSFMIWLFKEKWAGFGISFDDAVSAYSRMDIDTKKALIQEYESRFGDVLLW